MNCEHCGTYRVVEHVGQRPRFCSTRCRVASHRASKRIPKELTERHAWTRADGKRPIQANGRAASSTDPRTWSSFVDVQTGAGDGFGVMLGDGLGCWDLDDCFKPDGSLKAAALRILKSADPVYVERSMSGRGLHVFIHAPEGPGQKVGNVERYTRSRFIRVTGNAFKL